MDSSERNKHSEAGSAAAKLDNDKSSSATVDNIINTDKKRKREKERKKKSSKERKKSDRKDKEKKQEERRKKDKKQKKKHKKESKSKDKKKRTESHSKNSDNSSSSSSSSSDAELSDSDSDDDGAPRSIITGMHRTFVDIPSCLLIPSNCPCEARLLTFSNIPSVCSCFSVVAPLNIIILCRLFRHSQSTSHRQLTNKSPAPLYYRSSLYP
jgi:hypothetical protein